MKANVTRAGVLALLLAASGCTDESALVARAGDSELTVDETVALLAGVDFPNQPIVAITVADLWIDYTLLARAVAEDSTLADLDVSRVVDLQLQQELILALREKLVHPDTVVSEEEIDRRVETTTPGSKVHARHILIAPPAGGIASQHDSARAFADGLVARIRRGESFEQLARQHSADRATADAGGDLGWFGPGELMAELEQAVFALRVGEVSDVILSPAGMHIIRVEEREAPTQAEMRAQVRTLIQQERVLAAESTLIAGIEQGAEVEIVDGATLLVREAAENPGQQLSRRARNRELVTYRGGAVTFGDITEFMQGRVNQFRLEILNAPDEALEQNLLVPLAQRELMVERARAEGITIPEARSDSLAIEIRARLLDVARSLELVGIRQRAGESEEEARTRKVEELVGKMIRGERDVVPLASLSFVLRDAFSGQVYPTGADQVVARVAAERGPAADTGAAQPLPAVPGPLAPQPITP